MDIVRGGSFETIPTSYPASVWYTYDDSTYEYNCQFTEYFYWLVSTVLGALEPLEIDINNEWKISPCKDPELKVQEAKGYDLIRCGT